MFRSRACLRGDAEALDEFVKKHGAKAASDWIACRKGIDAEKPGLELFVRGYIGLYSVRANGEAHAGAGDRRARPQRPCLA